MKTSLTFLLILSLFSFTANAQTFDRSGEPFHVLIAANETGQIVYSSNDYVEVYSENLSKAGVFIEPGNFVIPASVSRYMFDNDDGLEFLVQGQRNMYLYNGTLSEPYGFDVFFKSLSQSNQGAVLTTVRRSGDDDIEQVNSLPGNTPQYDDFQYKMTNWYQAPQPPSGRVDTVFVTETITRVDTVYQLTENRIYVEGNVDTVYQINEERIVEDRVTRDSVFTITSRVDSVYLLGGDYLDDLNRVTSVENQLEVQKLGNPYPNPASTTVSIDYVTAVPTANMFLGIYDNQGRPLQ